MKDKIVLTTILKEIKAAENNVLTLVEEKNKKTTMKETKKIIEEIVSLKEETNFIVSSYFLARG